jgi:DNA-nicking Smr family endonuclease
VGFIGIFHLLPYFLTHAYLWLAEKNRDRSPDEIDLHGLFVQEATERAEEAIARCQREGRDHLTIIVGRGNHSIGQ